MVSFFLCIIFFSLVLPRPPAPREYDLSNSAQKCAAAIHGIYSPPHRNATRSPACGGRFETREKIDASASRCVPGRPVDVPQPIDPADRPRRPAPPVGPNTHPREHPPPPIHVYKFHVGHNLARPCGIILCIRFASLTRILRQKVRRSERGNDLRTANRRPPPFHFPFCRPPRAH